MINSKSFPKILNWKNGKNNGTYGRQDEPRKAITGIKQKKLGAF